MFVGSNGLITFGSGSSASANAIIPSGLTPNNAIYALWDDLYPIGGVNGNVFVKQIDATRTVVQWQAVGHCCSSAVPETFQVILNGADHSITLQYLNVTDTSSATVGVENANGSEGILIAFNQPGYTREHKWTLKDPEESPLETILVEVSWPTQNAVCRSFIDFDFLAPGIERASNGGVATRSSPETPASRSKSSVASSLMTSMTSSTVTTPMRCPLSDTTGTAIRS